MQISVDRGDSEVTYKVPFRSTTLLKALYHIKSYQDQTLTFGSNCRSGICGECAVRVNGREVLACAYKVQSGDKVSPLRYQKVSRDLKVERNSQVLKGVETWLHQPNPTTIEPKDVKLTEKQSDCILCNSCYSACPVVEVNPNFLAPFALTRVYRYVSDPREGDKSGAIAQIQTNGIWDCTLCGECTAVCPQNIDPKMDIIMLRTLSTQLGYSDPNFTTMDFGSFF
jgi:fumarate reductase iron-sulfur subunit